MENITVKFVVASDAVIAALMQLGRAAAMEKYKGLLAADVLEQYISLHFNEKALTNGINNFSSQWLMAYAGENAVGFACLNSKGKRPRSWQHARSIGITAFCMLQGHDTKTLLEKCMQLAARYDAVWMMEQPDSPLAKQLAQRGFQKADTGYEEGLPLPLTYFVKA